MYLGDSFLVDSLLFFHLGKKARMMWSTLRQILDNRDNLPTACLRGLWIPLGRNRYRLFL